MKVQHLGEMKFLDFWSKEGPGSLCFLQVSQRKHFPFQSASLLWLSVARHPLPSLLLSFLLLFLEDGMQGAAGIQSFSSQHPSQGKSETPPPPSTFLFQM